MKAVASMTALSLPVWLVALAVAGVASTLEVTLGVVTPLVVACGGWVMMERTYTRQPGALTSMMIAAFGFKLLFFGGCVALGLRGLSLETRPFVGSLAAAFIVLHMAEAYFLSALFKTRSGSAGS